MNGKKLALKIFLIILAALASGFLTQVGIYIYKIKTGKISPGTFSHNITAAKNVSGAEKISAAEILDSSAPYFGAANPKLTVVEFGNFACGYSRDESSVARQLMIKYKNDIKFIYRNYPLDDIYPNSSYLSLAGRCAQEQGGFWAMHDKLYGGSGEPTAAAQQIGLDTKKFADCMSGQKYLADLNKDLTDGYKNGVAGTPTFFFMKPGAEPIKVAGAIPKEIFQQIIDNLLK